MTTRATAPVNIVLSMQNERVFSLKNLKAIRIDDFRMDSRNVIDWNDFLASVWYLSLFAHFF